MNYAIILCGGTGSRMNADINKVYLPIHGVPVVLYTLRAFERAKCVDEIVLVIAKKDADICKSILSTANISKKITLCFGGKTRALSVKNGLDAIPDTANVIAVHDGARPLITSDEIDEMIKKAEAGNSIIYGARTKDTIKICKSFEDRIIVDKTLDRSSLFNIATPQVFRSDVIKNAYAKKNTDSTDDASLVEPNERVYIYEGSYNNIKITTKEDLLFASNILNKTEERGMFMNSVPFRVGYGFDAHRLVENRPLVLCGIEIPHKKGLLGHSDADVAVHALMDALLGAAALGDIGKLFPPTDKELSGISSMLLLEKVVSLLCAKNFKIINVDITIVAEKPKLSPYIADMRENLSSALGVCLSCVSIKATTTEGMGYEGREEGMSSFCTLLVEQQ